MSKPKDKTAAKLRERFDQLDEYDTASTRKDIREAKRTVKKQMVRHDRNEGKRNLRDALYGDTDD